MEVLLSLGLRSAVALNVAMLDEKSDDDCGWNLLTPVPLPPQNIRPQP